MNDVDTNLQRFFDPESRRNHEVPAVPVKLSDGRIWWFAAATDRYRPSFIGDRFVGVDSYRGFPPPCDEHADALAKASEENPDAVPVALILGLAASLVRTAHNLSPEEATKLLSCDDDGLTRIVSAIVRAHAGVETTDRALTEDFDQPANSAE